MPRFFASCPKGIENLLLEELRSFGAAGLKATDAGAGWEGEIVTGYRACLWSRLASRVYLELARFPAESPDALYAGARAVRWHEHMGAKSTFCIDASLRASQIANSHFAALKVKDAVADFFRDREGARPTVVKENPEIRVNLHVRGGEAVVSLDLAGSPLHERGYRGRAGAAPLKENLAAAILARLGWETIAKAGGGFVDPMCGSGTLVIEAGLIAFDQAPGLLRKHWGFAGWRGFERQLWRELLVEAKARARAADGRGVALLGADSDGRVLQLARANAEAAGLAGRVRFLERKLRSWPAEEKRSPAGLLVTNPPYGERMGEIAQLTETYAELGELLRTHFQGWKAGVFTGNPNLGKVMGIRAEKRYAFWNGSIPCELLTFSLAEEKFVKGEKGSEVQVGKGKVALTAGGTAFRNRLIKNFRHLQKWAKREGLACFRVYDADIPDYNVAVDLYDDAAVVQEYAAPREIPERESERRLQEALLIVPEVLGVKAARVFVKTRTRQRGTAQYTRQEVREVVKEVEEYGHRFLVNFTNYLDTGLFLDHRMTRKMMGELAKGKSFLNLFGYTGSATVYAAAGGAARTVTVDLSNTYIEWAKRNMALNGFTGPEHEFIQADCRLWLERAKGKFDLIFIDPPTFSNSKKLRKPFQVQQDYLDLIANAARLLSPRGKIFFSNNFRQFKMDVEAIGKLGLLVTDISRRTIPADFARNPRIHRAWVLEFGAVTDVVGDDPHRGRKKEKPKKVFHG